MIIRVYNYKRAYRIGNVYKVQYIDDIKIDVPMEGLSEDGYYNFSSIPIKISKRHTVPESEAYKLIPDQD